MIRGKTWGQGRLPAAVAVTAILALFGGAAAQAGVVTNPAPTLTEQTKPITAAAGSAEVNVRLARLSLDKVPALRFVDASLGDLTTRATTMAGALSSLSLKGLALDDRQYLDEEIHSGGPRSKVEKDQPRDVKRKGAELDMAIGGWAAEADPAADLAEARLGLLSGALTANKIGVTTSIGERGLLSSVSKEGARARAALTVEGFAIDLGALLPVDLVALPFGMTFEMVERLEIPLPEDLADDVARFRGTLKHLRTVEETLILFQEARARLEERLAEAPEVLEALDAKKLAEDLLNAALTDLANTQAALTNAEATLAAAQTALTAAQDNLAAAQANLASAQASLAAAQADVAALQAQIATLDAEIAALSADPVQAALNADEILAKQTQRAAAATQLTTAQAAESAAQTAVGNAQAAVANAEAAVTAATDEENAAKALRDAAKAARDAAKSAVDEARSRLATAQVAYQAAMDAHAEVDEEIALLRDDLVALKARLAVIFLTMQPLLAELRDLAGLHEGLLDALKATPVLKVGAVHLVADARVDGDKPATEGVCTVSGLVVLGKPLPTVTCDELRDLRTGIQAKLAGLLEVLGGEPVVGVQFDGPSMERTVQGQPDVDDFRRAQVTFTPLKVTLPSVEVGDVVDDVHARLGTILELILAETELQTMPELVGQVEQPLSQAPVLSLAVPTAVPIRVRDNEAQAAHGHDSVMDQIEYLAEENEVTPPGTPPMSETSGAAVELASLTASSVYRTADPTRTGGAGNGGGRVPDPGTGDGDGGAGRPGLGAGRTGSGEHSDLIGDGVVPAVGVSLPHTGGGASAALGGLALLMGAAALRRRREG